MATIKKLSLVDQVYDKLRDSIVTMEIPLGTKLNVSRLQEEYGVSSTPVREAMNRLLNDGLIELRNNVGARVVNLSERDIREMLEVEVSSELAAFCFALHKSEDGMLATEYKKALKAYERSSTCKEYKNAMQKMREVVYHNAQNDRLSQKFKDSSAQNELLEAIFEHGDRGQIEVYESFRPHLEKLHICIENADINGGSLEIQECMQIAEKFMIQQIADMRQRKAVMV